MKPYPEIFRYLRALALVAAANFLLTGCGAGSLPVNDVIIDYTQAQVEQCFIRTRGIKSAATDYYEYKFGQPVRIRAASLKEYSLRGDLTQETNYDPAGNVKTITARKYDSYANVTEKTVYDASLAIQSRASYNYDAAGRLQTELHYDSAGALQEKGYMKYNDTGGRTEEVFYNTAGNVAGSVLYEYGGKTLAAKRSYDSAQALLAEIKYYYDASGARTKEEYASGQTRETSVFSQGRLAELDQTVNGVLANKMIYAYNSEGLLERMTGYNTNAVINEPVFAYITAYTKY